MTDRDDTLSDADKAVLAQAITEQRPSADRAEAINSRIMLAIKAEGAAPTNESSMQVPPRITLRVADRVWEKRRLGLEICVLHEDEHSRAALVRMAPGAFLPAHRHDMDEESLILEGDAQIGDGEYLQAGDYHFARAGEEHPIITSPNGCIVYVHGDRQMPMKVTPGFFSAFAKYLMPWKKPDPRDDLGR